MTFEDFMDEFWSCQARKVGKGLVRELLKKLVKRVDMEFLLMDAKASYYEEVLIKETEPRFICHPATYIRQGRYEDMDEEKRKRLAAQYDAMREREQQRKGNVTRLRVTG